VLAGHAARERYGGEAHPFAPGQLFGRLSTEAQGLLIRASVYRSPIGHDVLLLPVGPYSPSELAALVDEFRAAGLLVADPTADPPSVFVHWWTAFELHRLLTEQQRGGEITDAHRRAAENWRWRITAWPQDHRAQREAGYHPQVSELSRGDPVRRPAPRYKLPWRYWAFTGAIWAFPDSIQAFPGVIWAFPRSIRAFPGVIWAFPGPSPARKLWED
jgi:hypothetical protein